MHVPINQSAGRLAASVVFVFLIHRIVVLPSGPMTLSRVFTCLGLCVGYPDSLGEGASRCAFCVPLSYVGGVHSGDLMPFQSPVLAHTFLNVLPCGS